MARIVLNRSLTLEAPQRAPDGAGGFTQTWVIVGALWAQVTARIGREAARGGATLSNTTYRIMVRAAPHGSPSRPSPEQRFRDDMRVFRIESVAETDAAGRYLTCFCEEEVAV